MSEKREDQRPENEKLWDKTFEDNEDVDSKGNLSRVKRRKQDSHNSRITTILVVLIIILAAAPIIYWVRHEQAFDHPVRHERVAQSAKVTKKKSASEKSSHHKRHPSSSSSIDSSQDYSTTNNSSTEMAASSAISSSRASSSSTESSNRYATVQSGQGIYRIAANNGLTVDQLARINNISPNTAVHPGQRLRVK